jgi:hypothetical protein
MTSDSRSLDDLPLAAYSKGVKPDPGLAPHEIAGDQEIAAANSIAPPIDESVMAELDPADGEPVARSASLAAGLRGRIGRPLPVIPEWLARPREHLRDPRLLLSGVIAVGLVLLVVSLIPGGGGAAGTGAGASPSAPVSVPSAPPPPGNASVDVTGKLTATLALAGLTGSGAAVESRIDATWGDATGATLGLRGPAQRGTRTTDSGFVLTLTVLVNGAPVTFTSDARECTIGMAVQPKSVNGTFVCKKLKSDDGKHVVDARGSYRT